MTEERVRISASCDLVVEDRDGHHVYIEYTEHGNNYDYETEAPIDEATARAMIALLRKAFPALASEAP
jgi:hypothetical protein